MFARKYIQDRLHEWDLRPVHTKELAPAKRSRNMLPEQSSLVCTNDFMRKKWLRNNFCTRVYSIESNWLNTREQAPGANLLRDQAPSCVSAFKFRCRLHGDLSLRVELNPRSQISTNIELAELKFQHKD